MSVARRAARTSSAPSEDVALPLGDEERRGRAEAARTIGLVPSLDGVRGIFVLVAVMGHLLIFIPWWLDVVGGSFVGVDLFFVMSGFLITSILLREVQRTGRIGLSAFYQGRVLRLMPALFAMVAAEFVWSMFRHYPLDYELKAVASALTYSSNWGLHMPWSFNFFQQARYDVAMPQLWSLAVEEQFYLLWPLMLIGLLAVARRYKWVPVTFVVIGIILVTIHRVTAVMAMPETQFKNLGWYAFYQRTDYRADDLMWGVLLAFLWVRGWFPRRGLKLAAWIGLAFLVVFIFVGKQSEKWVYLWGLPALAIGSFAIVLACTETDWAAKRWLETRWLCAIGVVSYGLYVWHVLIYQMVHNAVPHWPVGYQIALAFAATAAATVLSWYFIEKPALRLKDRLRRRSAAQQSSGTAGVQSAAPAPPDEAVDAIDPEADRILDTSRAPE